LPIDISKLLWPENSFQIHEQFKVVNYNRGTGIALPTAAYLATYVNCS